MAEQKTWWVLSANKQQGPSLHEVEKNNSCLAGTHKQHFQTIRNPPTAIPRMSAVSHHQLLVFTSDTFHCLS